MYYAGLDKYSTENGPGIRVSLFVSGCRHKCKGCFNKEAWDFKYGKEYTSKTREEVLSILNQNKEWYSGLSLLGGDPLEPENRDVLLPLVQKVREIPNMTIWVWTGKLYEHLTYGDTMFLSYCDVLVDGPFIEKLYSPNLKYRGSSNQRVIDLRRSEDEGHPITII